MIYLQIFWEFFKTGLFSIGGGLATIPFLYDIGNRYDWLDIDIIPDMIAISESTPGPIGINMATYTGYMAAGIPGALLATLSIVLPSVIIVLLIVRLLVRFDNHPLVVKTMYTLRPASLGLIAASAYSVFHTAIITGGLYAESGRFIDLFDLGALILFAVLLLIRIFFKKLHPLYYIAAAGIVGIIFKF